MLPNLRKQRFWIIAGTVLVGSLALSTFAPVREAISQGVTTVRGTVTATISGAALTSLQLIDNLVGVEDDAHSNGEGLAKLGCRRIDSAASSAVSSGDWATVDCDASGALRVRVDSTAVGSTSENDDGSLATGTTSMSEVLSKPYAMDSNASAWTRWTHQLLDFDSGAGTENLSVFGIALPASGGPAIGGTTTAPFQVQSNSANLATQTTLASALTALELIDDDQTGASMYHRISAGTTEDEHEVKGSAGRLFAINTTNTNAAVRYLRCANQVAASTTPGTTTVWYGMAIPGNTAGAGFGVSFGPSGVAFSTGLTCWIVTGAAESDVAEVAANEINVNYVYK